MDDNNNDQVVHFVTPLYNEALSKPKIPYIKITPITEVWSTALSGVMVYQNVFTGYRYQSPKNKKSPGKSNFLLLNKPIDIEREVQDNELLTSIIDMFGLDDKYYEDISGAPFLPPDLTVPAPPLVYKSPKEIKGGIYTSKEDDIIISGNYLSKTNTLIAHGTFKAFMVGGRENKNGEDEDEEEMVEDVYAYIEAEYNMGVLRSFKFYDSSLEDETGPIENKEDQLIFTLLFDTYGMITKFTKGGYSARGIHDLRQNNSLALNTGSFFEIDRTNNLIYLLHYPAAVWLVYSPDHIFIPDIDSINNNPIKYLDKLHLVGIQLHFGRKGLSYWYHKELTKDQFYKLLQDDIVQIKDSKLKIRSVVSQYIPIPDIQNIILGYSSDKPFWFEILTKTRDALSRYLNIKDPRHLEEELLSINSVLKQYDNL